MIKSDISAKQAKIKPIKKRGVDRDFLMSFRGVFTMKQVQTLGTFSIPLSSFYSWLSEISSIISMAFLPFLSLVSLLAPLTRRVRTGRADLNYSTLLIAR